MLESVTLSTKLLAFNILNWSVTIAAIELGFFLYLYVRDYGYLLNPPVSLKPVPRLCNIGKVVRPAFIFNPVTPMDIGELDLVNPEIFPNDNVPQGLVAEPVVAIPTTLVVDRTLQVSIPAFATLENASILYTLFKMLYLYQQLMNYDHQLM